MFIIKKEKPFFERFGLHHAGITFAVMLVIGLLSALMFNSFLLGAIPVYIGMLGFFLRKELRENGKDFEILDLASPAVINGVILGFLIWRIA